MDRIPSAKDAAAAVLSRYSVELAQLKEETDNAVSAFAQWLIQIYMQDERPPLLDLSRSFPRTWCIECPIRWRDRDVIEGAKTLLSDHNWILQVTETSFQLRPLPGPHLPIPIPISQSEMIFVF